jgi:serine/threonine protein phosphatase 1
MTDASARFFAIGDIHGCLPALDKLLATIQPKPEDTVVTLGDYVDRGPKSREVLERLIQLQKQCTLIPILGNHDQMMLMVHDGRQEAYIDWLLFGGSATMQSYHSEDPKELPEAHIAFLRSCRLFYETEHYFFVHGNYQAELPLDRQPIQSLMWESLKARRPGPHVSGKIAIVGHSSQKSGEILDLGYLKCIDTCCYGDGWLTAIELHSGKIWQADKKGQLRGEKKKGGKG